MKLFFFIFSFLLLSQYSAALRIKKRNYQPYFEAYGVQGAELFRRFHDHVAGSGVGLVQRLVEQVGGRVEVESEVGKGSTFRVLLHPA